MSSVISSRVDKNVCPRCFTKLGIKERYLKKHSERIYCSKCGAEIVGDIIFINGRKINRDMVMKRYNK